MKRSSKRLRLQEQRSTRRALPGNGMQERYSLRTKRLTMLCPKYKQSLIGPYTGSFLTAFYVIILSESRYIKRGAELCQTQNRYRRGLQRSTAQPCIMRLQVQGIHSSSSMDTCWIEDHGTINSQFSPNVTGSFATISEALAIQG